MNRTKANLLLLLAALIWGVGFVVQQVGVGKLGTMSFTGARFLVGGILVLPFALRQFTQVHTHTHRFTSTDWVLLLVVGTVLFIAASLQQFGILHTSVANSGFLTGLYVPLVPALSLCVFRHKVHWAVWPASCCCILGTYIISGSQQIHLGNGDLWVISSTFFWASHVLLVGMMATRTKAPLVVASAQFCICGFLGIFFGSFFEHSPWQEYITALPGILYVGIFSVGMAFTLQVVGQRYTPASDAAIILSSETVFAALAGFLFLNEQLTGGQFVGASLILSGILLVELLPLSKIGKPQALS